MATNPPCALFQIMTTGCSCRRLVLTMLFLTTLLTLSSSASLPSLLRKFRHGVVTKNNDCIQDMAVSAICYHCGSLNPSDFHSIHTRCCDKADGYREICAELYTEEPKRGRRDSWY